MVGLIINAGSSSLKFMILKKEENGDLEPFVSGIFERIGLAEGIFQIKSDSFNLDIKDDIRINDHGFAIKHLLKVIKEKKLCKLEDIKFVSHRIVHGKDFDKSVVIDKEVLKKIKEYGDFAPLHNPAAALAIEALQKTLDDKVVHVAVFDTAYHQTIPRINYEYAIPKKWRASLGIRRYGFHGTSYRYIAHRAEALLKKENVNLIVCHLGNGASLCAVKDGKSFNTSMGFTPLAGLIMGTRSGDVAPSIFTYVSKHLNKSVGEIENALNKESGMLSLAGMSDMRDVEESSKTDPEAKFALDLWAKRVADYVMVYYNDLKTEVDALVFTAGIGENSGTCRKLVVDRLKSLGLEIDEEKNSQRTKDVLKISTPKSKIPIYIIATNEEGMMAQDGYKYYLEMNK